MYQNLGECVVRADYGNCMMSDIDVVSQMTGSKSVMIRKRGALPRTIWQKGALQTNKGDRKGVSQGKDYVRPKSNKYHNQSKRMFFR